MLWSVSTSLRYRRMSPCCPALNTDEWPPTPVSPADMLSDDELPADGWENWKWDPTVFAGAAPPLRPRPPAQAPGLAAVLGDALGLDGTGCLLAVGCGRELSLATRWPLRSGGLPRPRSRHAHRRRAFQASEQGVAVAARIKRRAEDLPAALGSSGSYHSRRRSTGWTAPRWPEPLHSMLVSKGAVEVHAPAFRSAEINIATLVGPPPPIATIDEPRQGYLGPNAVPAKA